MSGGSFTPEERNFLPYLQQAVALVTAQVSGDSETVASLTTEFKSMTDQDALVNALVAFAGTLASLAAEATGSTPVGVIRQVARALATLEVDGGSGQC